MWSYCGVNTFIGAAPWPELVSNTSSTTPFVIAVEKGSGGVVAEAVWVIHWSSMLPKSRDALFHPQVIRSCHQGAEQGEGGCLSLPFFSISYSSTAPIGFAQLTQAAPFPFSSLYKFSNDVITFKTFISFLIPYISPSLFKCTKFTIQQRRQCNLQGWENRL